MEVVVAEILVLTIALNLIRIAFCRTCTSFPTCTAFAIAVVADNFPSVYMHENKYCYQYSLNHQDYFYNHFNNLISLRLYTFKMQLQQQDCTIISITLLPLLPQLPLLPRSHFYLHNHYHHYYYFATTSSDVVSHTTTDTTTTILLPVSLSS